VPSLLTAVADALTRSGLDLATFGFAWARAMPTVVLVPAFGLRALPGAARAVIALGLAGVVFPALHPLVSTAGGAAWPLQALGEMWVGLPVAVSAAVPLWAATMTGGVADSLRGAVQETSSAPTVEGGATALGVPLSILAACIFLTTGGPARVAAALLAEAPAGHPLLATALHLASGIELAVALAGPLLAASIVIEVSGALIARSAAPAQIHFLLAPLRALVWLVVFGLSFEGLALVLGSAVERAP
jgi:flagellar biosynthesis protein FliR